MIRISLLSLMVLFFFTGELPAQSSGMLTYEVTRKVDGGKVRIIRSEGGGTGTWTESSGGMEEDVPTVITLKQKVVFTPGLGKMESPTPAMEMPAGTQVNIMRPYEEQVFVDFNTGRLLKYLQAGMGQDSITYFTEEAFETAPSWEVSKKTKKILGYECQKASVEWEGNQYSVWYTDELNMTFSPINGLVPESGFVLGIEGDDKAYEAKAIEFKEIDPQELLPPGPAKAVDAEGYQSAKTSMLEKLGQERGMQMIKH